MAGLIEQNQIRGVEQRFAALEAGGGVSGGTGLLEPLTPRVDELTEIYTRYAFDKQYLNYLYLNNPVTLTVPPYLESTGKPDIEKSRFDLFYIYLPSNSLRIVSGEQAESPSVPGVPENSIYVAFSLINGDGTSEIGANSTNSKCIYISSAGNDANLGLTETSPIFTWGRALARISDTGYRVVRCVDNSTITVTTLPYSVFSPFILDAPNATVTSATTIELISNCLIRANRVNCPINIAQGKSSVLFDVNTFYRDVTITRSEVRFLRDTAIKGTLNLIGAAGEGAIYCNTIWANSWDFGDAMVVQGCINGKLKATNTMFGHTILDNGTAEVSRANLNFKGFALTDDSTNNATVIASQYTIAFFNTLLPCPVLHSAAVTLTLVKDAAINVVEYSVNNGTTWTAYSVPVAVAANSETLWRVASFNAGYDKGCLILNIS